MIQEFVAFGLSIGGAVAGDLLVEQMKGESKTPVVNWLAASAGAAMALLTVGGCVGGLFFWVDPWWWIVQTSLIGGIVAAIVDIPLVVWRGWRHRSGKAIGLEVLCILIGAVLLVALMVVFRTNYKQVVLPI
jgi:hypothetical protein